MFGDIPVKMELMFKGTLEAAQIAPSQTIIHIKGTITPILAAQALIDIPMTPHLLTIKDQMLRGISDTTIVITVQVA